MNEIKIQIKNWKEQRESAPSRHGIGRNEQFEVFVDGEKIPRVKSFAINLKNDINGDTDIRDALSYTIEQYINFDEWEIP